MQGDTVQDPDARAGQDTAAPGPGMTATEGDRRLMLAVGHTLLGGGVFALWAAADAWQAVTGLFAAALLAVVMAVPAGAVFATLVHEWCHFLGARLAGARYRVPARFGLFVFDFDYAGNSVEQFRTMSYAGQAGSALGVLLLWFALPMDTAGRAMVVSAAVGSGVFGAMIEWPVLARVRAGATPLVALGGIDKDTLYRSAGTGAVAMLVLWLLLA